MKESNKISLVESDQADEIDYSEASRMVYGTVKRLCVDEESPAPRKFREELAFHIATVHSK